MPEKKVNVLSQLLCVFKSKKPPCKDIVAVADKVVEDYIFSKNKLIHRKCRKGTGGLRIFAFFLALGLAVAFLYFSIV